MDDFSAIADRMTPASTPLRVRTRCVIASAMIRTLAATPSRFQPMRCLKPCPSAVSNRCIRPPGGARTGGKPIEAIDGKRRPIHSYAKFTHQLEPLRQKRRVVQPLTTPVLTPCQAVVQRR